MNTFTKKVSRRGTKSEDKKSKLIYPSWKSLTIDYLSNARRCNPNVFNDSFSDFNKIFSKLDLVQTVIEQNDPVKLILFLADAEALYVPKSSFESVLQSFQTISVRSNEFYAVFDLYNFRHLIVDEKIREIMGLEPEDFNLKAMAGRDPKNALYHPRDNNHVMRHASIAYYMFTLGLFKWNSIEDQYRVRFRVGMSKSKLERYRNVKYVTLEKLCFLFYDKISDGIAKPIYHFDKWLVYDETEFDFVRPYWISNHERQRHLNHFQYLINAYLLQVPIQFLLLLHERQFHDRNKAISVSLSAKIAASTGIEDGIDEHQVADCFAKTIRNKMGVLMNVWDKRSPDDLESVISDPQAVSIAKTLGLLPIPEQLLTAIYRDITEV